MWQVNINDDEQAIKLFSSLESVMALDGEPVTQCSLSDVIIVETNKRRYYVKRYHQAGKGLRRYFGRSRIRGEWENLQYFRSLQIPTADISAYGESRCFGFKCGAMITAAIPNTIDLSTLAEKNSPLFHDFRFRQSVMKQVATYTAKLHAHRFIHRDLKWRNILVTLEADPQVFFIDCPLGSHSHFRFAKGKSHDLACLDKLAKRHCSVGSRLRFMVQYTQALLS